MKNAARTVTALLICAALAWTIRAVYLYRVWQIAHVWFPATPAPRFAPCVLGNVSATSAHGVYADMAFLRVSLDPETARNEPLRQTVAAANGAGEPATVPLTSDVKTDAPCPPQRFRIVPPELPAAIWGRCYGVSDWWKAAAVSRGAAIVQAKPTGGVVLLDADRSTLYIAAYRTR